jgi:cytochrome c oxidase subunit II
MPCRRQIGANLLPNTREGLGRWIVDPQGVKPGNLMPDVGLEGDDLDLVLDFLQELD